MRRLAGAWRRVEAWAVLLLLAALLFSILPPPASVELDPDEGGHLMMAWLFRQGYAFFSQIRYDHFPLFDVLLTGWLRLFGFTVETGRAMAVVGAVLLLWALFMLVRDRFGRLPAFAAVLLALIVDDFLRVAGTLLQGCYWIAFGLLALLCLRRRSAAKHPGLWLLLSALMLAAAVQIKLFALLMVPALCAEFWPAERGWRASLSEWLRWVGAGLVCSLLLVLVSAPALLDAATLQESWRYLVLSHLGLDSLLPHKTLGHMLHPHGRDFPVLVMACCALLLWRRIGLDHFPLLWLLTDLLALATIHPVWNHYYILVSIPIVWLAAQGVAALRDGGGVSAPIALRQGIVVMLWVLVALLPARVEHLADQLHWGHRLSRTVLNMLDQATPEDNHWVVTDRPVYAFVTGLNAPPELAVTSLTLMHSGLQSAVFYLEMVDRYRPAWVLLARFPALRKALPDALRERGYHRVYLDRRGIRLYQFQG